MAASGDLRSRHLQTHDGRKDEPLRAAYLLSKRPTWQEAATLIPGHWKIENSLHRTLGIVMNDDQLRARKDNEPANFAAKRRIALGIIKAMPAKGSNRAKFKKAGWNNGALRTLIAGS